MALSRKQNETMRMIEQINKTFGNNRWFTKAELPGVTQHTLDALVNNRFKLHTKTVKIGNGTVVYYKLRDDDNAKT